MSVLEFDKNQLGNLEYSLRREMLSTNRAGGYMSTTLVGCNTRKYHGLFVGPVIEGDDCDYVMLSSLDETVVQHDHSFNLAIHRFPETYEPKGHKYLVDFNYTPFPALTYRVGGVVLRKDILWIHSRAQLLIRYTLLEAQSPTTLKLRPFLAFRNKHSLSKANFYADGHSYPATGGVRNRLYEGFPWLYMQTDAPDAEFVAAPDWYYNFEYAQERERGYDYLEDLLTTGYFEMKITRDKPVIFSCSLEEVANIGDLKAMFESEAARRSAKNDFLSCLRHSARQFIARRESRTEVIAGYPWFGRWGRDTFIALPGITLSQGDAQSCMDVLDTLTGEMKDGLFPNMGSAYNSVDAPLWFFWTVQQLESCIPVKEIWIRYGEAMTQILDAYRNGVGDVVKVLDNGLVWAAHPDFAMTWMDAVVDGVPVTGREGCQVEVNALWYNAVCYALELAEDFGDRKFAKRWRHMPEVIRKSFLDAFWYGEGGYLADYVTDDGTKNVFIRPNQVIACSLRYKMPDERMQISILDTVKRHLLTSRGLRTLSPQNPLYVGRYEGNQAERDRAYHQGTVWVWPLEHYVKAKFDLRGAAFLREAKELLAGFEEDISSYGIGSIPEIYDGDPPHEQRGAISQAWSVGALLDIHDMIRSYERKK